MQPITLILGLMLFPTAYALKCYQCIPGHLSGGCVETKQECYGIDRCGSVTINIPVGGMKMDIKTKHCTDLCVTGSADLGFGSFLSECCATDLCNVKYPTPPASPPPNGLKCFTCKDNDCSNVLQCAGDQNRCISGRAVMRGIEAVVAKGCATQSMCVGPAIVPGVMDTDARCCEGDLCNSF